MVTLGMVFEEMAHHKIGDTLQVLSVLFAGNLILRMGTQYQKQKYLKKLAQGQIFMSILYSEIEAGSDLAGLQSMAIPIGDDFYELTGTKTYNLKSMQADYALCAARTNSGLSKYDGISLFIVDLKTKAVQIKKLPTLSNESYCEVHFEKALVHKSDIIGEVDKGWAMLNDALGLERTGLDLLAKLLKWIELLSSIIKLQCCISEKKATDLYNQLNFKITNAKYFVYQILMSLDNRQTLPEIVAATAKYHMGELAYEAIQKIVLVVDWLKLSSIDNGKQHIKTLELALRETPGLTLSAGASEIMLETISRIEFFL
jgi:alkylation response protein AidB-like acyl-CoA dehydrogenase